MNSLAPPSSSRSVGKFGGSLASPGAGELGAIILMALRRNGRYGLETMRIGGQGIAAIFKRAT